MRFNSAFISIYFKNQNYLIVEFLIDDDTATRGGNEANHLATLPEEEAVVAMMGLPRAGDITRAQLRIKESKEFKV